MDKHEDIEIVEEASEGGNAEDLEGAASGASGKLAKLKKELAKIKEEKQEYLDGWQRAKADYVNALKRFEAERAAALELGKVMTISAFIPVMDSLDRAEAAGEVPESFKGIAKQLHEAARTLGLEKFGKIGDEFDPNLHEALGQSSADSQEEDNKITTVFEPGWRSKEGVIRPAKVRVSHYA